MARILTFNCHEAYIHLLGKLGIDLDVVDGLPGRYCARWDARMRPVPARVRLISLETALSTAGYDAAIAHNVSDLLLLRALELPKILVLHVSLEARVQEEPGAPPLGAMREQLATYLRAISGTAVAVSRMKAASWGQDCPIIRPGIDPDEYQSFDGQEAVALRVANQVLARPLRFAWAAHTRITQDHPLRLVGHNPGLAGSEASGSWQELRAFYQSHRAYVHTAGAGLDDGYNLALVEAMMTGMPIVSLAGSESPVVDAVNGYVSNDPELLNARLGLLLRDVAHARELGQRARETALLEFSLPAFISGWSAALERARRTWLTSRQRAH